MNSHKLIFWYIECLADPLVAASFDSWIEPIMPIEWQHAAHFIQLDPTAGGTFEKASLIMYE